MRQKLAPDLKAKSYPVNFSSHSTFETEHCECVRAIIIFWRRNFHTRPRPRHEVRKSAKSFWVIVPIAPKVTRRSMGRKTCNNSTPLATLLVMLDRPENRHDHQIDCKFAS